MSEYGVLNTEQQRRLIGDLPVKLGSIRLFRAFASMKDEYQYVLIFKMLGDNKKTRVDFNIPAGKFDDMYGEKLEDTFATIAHIVMESEIMTMRAGFVRVWSPKKVVV